MSYTPSNFYKNLIKSEDDEITLRLDNSGSNRIVLDVVGGDLDISGGQVCITSSGDIHLFGLGSPESTNKEEIFIGWNDTDSIYEIKTLATGTGVERDIKIGPLSIKSTGIVYPKNSKITALISPALTNYSLKINQGSSDSLANVSGINDIDGGTIGIGAISFWMKMDVGSSSNHVIIWNYKGISYSSQYGCYWNSPGGPTFSSERIPITTSWQHMVLSSNGTSVKIYANGSYVSTGSNAQAPDTSTFKISDLSSGGWNLEDFRVYDYDLSATEVTDLYNGNDLSTDPFSHWKFNEGSGSTYDNISNVEMQSVLDIDPATASDILTDSASFVQFIATAYPESLQGDDPLLPARYTSSPYEYTVDQNGITLSSLKEDWEKVEEE